MVNLNARYRSSKVKAALGASLALIAITAAALPGCGGVDCTQGELLGKYNEGKSAAQQQMNDDSARGTRDGQALTYQQGKDASYATGYNRGFNDGYHSANGYNKGYSDGVGQGQVEGLSDPTSCANGSTDGYNVGVHDGRPVGNYDGYQDGYDDGYSEGMPDGVSSCFGGGSGVSQEDRDTCFNRGYRDIYSSSAYNNAFAAAKAANTEYQRGLRDGDTQGYTDGVNPGINQGYADGKHDGRIDGYIAGQQVAYTNCYNGSYPNGYNSGYNQGYSDPVNGYGAAPSFGSISDGTGGFGDGYYDGYVDGRASTCGGTVEGSTGTKRFGMNQSWAKVENGVTVKAYAVNPLPKTLTDAQKAQISSGIEASRKSLREELHANMKSQLE